LSGQPFRLTAGGEIDRARPLQFWWDERALQGYVGDTVAAALLANGVHTVARSFKYHRPRGIMTAGPEEPNALVTVHEGTDREEPNVRATCIALTDGLRVRSQNRWPSLRFDLGATSSLLAGLWPAGFYYKTFMWPRAAWSALYEPLIRRAAGSGRAPTHADPDSYSSRFAHCDVLVIGAGPAGIAAASAAADCGATVIVCDEQSAFGGSILRTPADALRGRSARSWVEQASSELRRDRKVTCLPGTTAFGYYAGGFLGLVENNEPSGATSGSRQRLWQVRAKQVVLASGAIERPMMFPNNDRPGVLLADAARSYLNRYAVRVGRAIVVYANHDSGYAAALDIQARAGGVRAIIDPRRGSMSPLAAAARQLGIEVFAGHEVCDTGGRQRIGSVSVAPVAASDSAVRKLACDTLLMAGGWTPAVHLFSHTNGKLRWDETLQAFIPGSDGAPAWCAGGVRGIMDLEDAVNDGERAGRLAAHAAGVSSHGAAPSSSPQVPVRACNAAYAPGHILSLARRPKVFVDFQNDACATDIALAIREGFRSIEHIKRYTTTGMATDQGKTSNMSAIAIAAALQRRPAESIGTTTFRPPYTPVTFGALAAEHRALDLDPVRVTPIHSWAREHRAVFEPVGLWQRARYFPQAGEDMHAAVRRECRGTRERAGIFDASTLGKIEVVGPDSAEFLNRIYTNAWTKLEVGRCRYGLMLKEDGFVLDDGVVARLAPDRFHVTTTTSGAARVLHHMEDYLQTEFTDLRVWLTSITEQWAVIAVNGPLARQVLEPLVEDIDLSASSFPHMAVREGTICGVVTRLFRVSFTGELGFEVNVPADAAHSVWECVQASAADVGAVTYGTETMHVLRAEKGYILVGQDTDGTVTPHDLGLDWAIGRSKPDFVGKRSLMRSGIARSGRKQLVGLLTSDAQTLLDEGAQVLFERPSSTPQRSEGYVTSSYHSVACARPIALALMTDGRSRMDTTVFVTTVAGAVEAKVVSPLFYDPQGGRINV
jgi:sarcosine oxidase subunit alpha